MNTPLLALPEPVETMACHDFDYAMLILRQAIDFAEIEHDFFPLRKWANEVEESGHGLKAIETRLNQSAGQNFLLANLQSVAAGGLSPEEAGFRICRWLQNGQRQDLVVRLTHQVQPA